MRVARYGSLDELFCIANLSYRIERKTRLTSLRMRPAILCHGELPLALVVYS